MKQLAHFEGIIVGFCQMQCDIVSHEVNFVFSFLNRRGCKVIHRVSPTGAPKPWFSHTEGVPPLPACTESY